MLLYNLQFFWVKAESELNISMICGGGADVEQDFSEEKRTQSQKNDTPSISAMDQRWPESLFRTLTSLLFQKFGIRIRVLQFFKVENPTPVQTPSTIINITLIFPCFLLKKWRHRLLLLLKLKSDSGSGSVFFQIFDSGSEEKTQNPTGDESGYPDPVPPLPWTRRAAGLSIGLDLNCTGSGIWRIL